MMNRVIVALCTFLICMSFAIPAAVAVHAAPAQVQPTPITAVVNTDGKRLRVRSGPGTSYPIIAKLTNGQRVPVLARNPEGSWLLITAPTQTYGWVTSSYVTLSVPLAEIPVAGIPVSEAPTPLPTAAVTAVSPTIVTTPTVMAMPTWAPTPAPTPVRLYGKLAVPLFDAERGVYDTWLVNANGVNLRRVVTEASAPALSADGAKLAYRRWQTDDRGIVVADSNGRNPLRVTDNLEDVLPSFSPDRTKVAFSSYRWGDRRSRLYYAWTDDESRTAWEWGDGGIYGEDPYWMADGRIIYRVTRRDGQGEELWRMDGSDGLNQTLLYAADSIRAPAAMKNSRAVAFMALADGHWDLYSVDITTSAVRRLTTDAADDGLPAWSPDGRHIAFVSNRSGEWGLWVMAANGNNQRLLTALPGSVDGSVEFEPDYLNKGWVEEQIAWSP